MASPKARADELAFSQGLAESRERAKRLIMAGEIYLEGPGQPQRVDKPGQRLSLECKLFLKQPERFVSRGGYKLLTAIESFGLDFSGLTALDAGASTGGFTDCLLQHGALKVYSVDVGRAQLHEKLKADSRVTSLEDVNLRHAPDNLLPELVDVITIDVSFISLTKVLPSCLRFLKPGGLVAALIKPQFEVGPGQTVKGVVKDESVRQSALDAVLAFCVNDLKLELIGWVPSRLKGPKGNQEYMACLRSPAL